VKLFFFIAKDLIRDPKMRRKTMFWVALAAMGMVAWGGLFLVSPTVNPWFFIVFWLGCGWLTLLLLLLALYDWMIVRSKLSAERRRLHAEFFDSSSDKKK